MDPAWAEHSAAFHHIAQAGEGQEKNERER